MHDALECPQNVVKRSYDQREKTIVCVRERDRTGHHFERLLN